MEVTDEDKEQEEGNAICILCVETGTAGSRGMAVLRLQLKAADRKEKETAEDCDLNTLLDPVCNPLNGGDL